MGSTGTTKESYIESKKTSKNAFLLSGESLSDFHLPTSKCHPRAGGDPEKLPVDLDSRLRGNDTGGSIQSPDSPKSRDDMTFKP